MQLTPRKYQSEIFETSKKNNTLVVLPTGLGKTLIALLLVKHRIEKFPESKILFLAPTRPLAEQHINYFHKYLPHIVSISKLFTGKIPASQRKELWEKNKIIFSTPQCISNDLKNNLYSLENVSLLIEDECHRCLKNYAYTFIAENYTSNSKNPRILGLTASPGSEKDKIKKICNNLKITSIESRNRESPDVKQYLQELETEIIKVDLPEKFQEIRDLLRTLFNKRIDELKKRHLLFGPSSKTNLIKLQGQLIKIVTSGNKNFNVLIGMSLTAQTIKIQHALELIETQTIKSFNEYIQKLFKDKSKASQKIIKSPEFNQAYIKTQEAIKTDHPKLIEIEKLSKQLTDLNKKVLIFSQYRATVEEINEKLTNQGIKSQIFIGQAKKKGKSMNQKQQQQIIKDFSENKIQCLIATSIGEEGLDIPEVGAVIFYEPVPSGIRKIQRAGRTARLKPGKLITLVTKKTRDETYFYAAKYKEKKMHTILSDMNDNLNKEQKSLSQF